MPLSKGQPAPEFVAEDINNNIISLQSYKGKKVFLAILRDAPCPFCNLRVHALIKQHQALREKGVEIITVFRSSKAEIMNYSGKQNAPFPIIADPEEKIFTLYNISQSQSGMFKAMLRMRAMMKFMMKGFFNLNSMTSKPVLPADFLIDEDGKIHKAHYGKDYGDHLPLDDVKKWANL